MKFCRGQILMTKTLFKIVHESLDGERRNITRLDVEERYTYRQDHVEGDAAYLLDSEKNSSDELITEIQAALIEEEFLLNFGDTIIIERVK